MIKRSHWAKKRGVVCGMTGLFAGQLLGQLILFALPMWPKAALVGMVTAAVIAILFAVTSKD